MARILETLERHPLFAGITREDLEPLVLACRLKTPMKEDRLFVSGEPAEAFYILDSGAVKLWNVATGGREMVVELVRPGDSFALMPVMEGGAYPVSATAIARSTVVRVPRDAFRRLLARRPELQARAAHEMAQKLGRMRRRLEEMTVLSVPSRVACHIVRLAEEEDGPVRQGAVVDLGGTREVVAECIGTVREVLVRSLRAMERDGLLALRGRRVEIRDPERLLGMARL